ncbi:MAG TPA: protoporphyrinogen oxidase [Polyangia bacterium]|nr:protoporphyrinogen oxidase [Polyangia bacterium]
MKRVVVAGAGISGLSLAFELERLGVSVLVLESERRAGGKIETDRRDGYICERGPASYLDRHNSITPLARSLGIESRVLPAFAAGERRLVVADGRLHDTPLDAEAFLRSRLLPVSAKLRMLADLVLPRGPSARGQEESVTAFASRRLGVLAGERLLQPLVSVLYAGDPDAVSLPAAFPLMAALEREHRSLVLGLRADLRKQRAKPRSGGDAPRLSSFVTGLDELTTALASRLGDRLRLGVRIVQVERAASGFRLAIDERGRSSTLDADAVVLAIPAHQACAVVAPLAPELSEILARIPYVPVALVYLGYFASALARPADAYGFFVPASEHLKILGAIFASAIFPDRAPARFSLFSVRTGGARHPEMANLPDEELTALAHADLRGLLGLTAPPAFAHIVRHQRGLPQYTLGHMDRVAALEAGERRTPGLYFHGNAYHNAGVPELVSRSGKLARRLAEELSR